MIDNDIKRKVAQDIRENYRRDGLGYTPVSAVNVAHAIGLHEGPLLDDLVFWARLADLIEPEPERTCHPVMMAWNGETPYRSSDVVLDAMTTGCSECGYPWKPSSTRLPNFCEHCGARVVDE